MKKILFINVLFSLFVFMSCKTGITEAEDIQNPSKPPVPVYKVTYTADKEYKVPEVLTVKKGHILSEEELPNPYDSTFGFLGWYTEEDELVSPDEFEVNSDLNLYAKWTYPAFIEFGPDENGNHYFPYICKDIPLDYTYTITVRKTKKTFSYKSGTEMPTSYKIDGISAADTYVGVEWSFAIDAKSTKYNITYSDVLKNKITEKGKVKVTFPSIIYLAK